MTLLVAVGDVLADDRQELVEQLRRRDRGHGEAVQARGQRRETGLVERGTVEEGVIPLTRRGGDQAEDAVKRGVADAPAVVDPLQGVEAERGGRGRQRGEDRRIDERRQDRLELAVGLGQFDDVRVGRGVGPFAVEDRDGLVDVGNGGGDEVALVVDDGDGVRAVAAHGDLARAFLDSLLGRLRVAAFEALEEPGNLRADAAPDDQREARLFGRLAVDAQGEPFPSDEFHRLDDLDALGGVGQLALHRQVEPLGGEVFQAAPEGRPVDAW